MMVMGAGSGGVSSFSLQRWYEGMARTDVLGDLWEEGPTTLVVPTDGAFDGLPWRFERLMTDPDMVEICIDLFEYLVVRDICRGDGPARSWTTVNGAAIEIGAGFVVGRRGRARILASLCLGAKTIHVVDACVFPGLRAVIPA